MRRFLGPVLLGQAPGRESEEDITLFDSTGLAIQDLGIVHAVMRALEQTPAAGAGKRRSAATAARGRARQDDSCDAPPCSDE